MPNVTHLLCIGLIASCVTLASQRRVSAQSAVVVAEVPSVVGYTAERRGLFGRRIVYRPVVTPVAATVPVAPTVAVARPVISTAGVAVDYAPMAAPVTSYYAPSAPVVTRYYAPSAPVVTRYYAPAQPVVVPVRSYRVRVAPYIPVFGF